MVKALVQKCIGMRRRMLEKSNSKHMQEMVNGYLKTKVKFIGESDPLALLNGKVYDAIVGQKGMICLVDETGDEYAYPPELFEIIVN